MGNTSITGPFLGTRQGSDPVRHTFPFDFSQRATTASSVLLGTITASADRPVQIIASIQVATAFNSGTSDTILLGTTTAGNEIIASGVTATTPGYYPTTSARARYTAMTPIYLKYTSAGTTPTTGSGVVLIECYQENTKPIL